MRRVASIFMFCLLILLTTCTKNVYNPDVCFHENVLPIFISNCTMNGCHNSTEFKGGFDLTNYDGIMQGIKAKHPLMSELYNSIRGNNPSMPPRSNTPLSSHDITYIKLWIEMGAPNSSNCNACDTSNYSYSNRINPIFQNWCVGCHNANYSSQGINLSDYAGASNPIVINRIVGSIEHSPGYFAMPQSGSQLSQCDINAIVKWINNGHPNN